MKCPQCNTIDEKIYVGFSSVECVNLKCSSYKSPETKAEVTALQETNKTIKISKEFSYFSDATGISEGYKENIVKRLQKIIERKQITFFPSNSVWDTEEKRPQFYIDGFKCNKIQCIVCDKLKEK